MNKMNSKNIKYIFLLNLTESDPAELRFKTLIEGLPGRLTIPTTRGKPAGGVESAPIVAAPVPSKL